MKILKTLLALCEGNPLVTGGLPLQRDNNSNQALVFPFLLSWTFCFQQIAKSLVISDTLMPMWYVCNTY